MRFQNTNNKNRLAVAAISVLMLGATVVACSGGGGSGGSSTPAPTPTPTPTPTPVVNGPAWLGYGGDAQHTALAQVQTQALSRIVWQTPVDVAPQYSTQGYLLVHYGSPAITSKNTVLVPVKRGAANTFRVEAHNGGNGQLAWSFDSDYVTPPHNWTPPYNVTLTKANRVVMPGAGGKVYYRDDADSSGAATGSLVFYGGAVYSSGQAAFDASVFINTPITVDNAGNLFFGFVTTGTNPAGLVSGIARIGADGAGSWVSAATAAGDINMIKPAMGAAPAMSADQKTVYVVVKGSGIAGQLLALDSATLARKSKAALTDPATMAAARVSEDSTASPMVGPDGDVYFGVLESVQGQHNSRGWLLHFDATLAQSKAPGSFGWDDTPSLVPASLVPGDSGGSAYLLMTKYNNYARSGTGEGQNRVAVLDPNVMMADRVTASVPVMKEVLSILGPTRDPANEAWVTEWCINTAAVDPFTKSILVNSEDGYLYRWDLATNTLSQQVRLTSGRGESYTPTAVGADGTVYAINNAVLFAVGK
ncbi:hypothetical protein Q4S45_20110 [Massilia sp. R2A-15]|uniref:hypothetical protein n=1 Tax=Massilia sp. R2A-15 TaxID=3064278 RepID=UPI0027342104|nr:hypothetical protein [Massilia sp. R2A-15]WLI88983.1 hypothetical protein Q4S45_20110 [Massilia sp. R2A-15]